MNHAYFRDSLQKASGFFVEGDGIGLTDCNVSLSRSDLDALHPDLAMWALARKGEYDTFDIFYLRAVYAFLCDPNPFTFRDDTFYVLQITRVAYDAQRKVTQVAAWVYQPDVQTHRVAKLNHVEFDSAVFDTQFPGWLERMQAVDGLGCCRASMTSAILRPILAINQEMGVLPDTLTVM